ncbi:938_t:CDS:2, partial [Funneliformis geosporum]
YPDVNPCLLCGKEIYSALNSPYKEFTLALCKYIFHQKYLEKYLVNDTTSKQVNLGDKIPIDETSDVYFRCPKHFETIPHYILKCLTLSPNVSGHIPKISHDNTDETDIILMNELGILVERNKVHIRLL